MDAGVDADLMLPWLEVSFFHSLERPSLHTDMDNGRDFVLVAGAGWWWPLLATHSLLWALVCTLANMSEEEDDFFEEAAQKDEGEEMIKWTNSLDFCSSGESDDDEESLIRSKVISSGNDIANENDNNLK